MVSLYVLLRLLASLLTRAFQSRTAGPTASPAAGASSRGGTFMNRKFCAPVWYSLEDYQRYD